jgi:Ca2+-binding EF-hand superfamily protein
VTLLQWFDVSLASELAWASTDVVEADVDVNVAQDWFKENESQGLQLPAMWDDVFGQMDVDQSGFVQYCEFLAGTLPKEIYLNDGTIKQAFAMIDASNDGNIDEEDLLTLVQHSVPRNVIQAIIAEVVPHGKMHLTYNDFKKMMSKENHSHSKQNVTETLNYMEELHGRVSTPLVITMASFMVGLVCWKNRSGS